MTAPRLLQDGSSRTSDPGTPLVGRERELDLLREALRAAAQGDGRVLLLTGESGSGKSTLAARLQVEAQRIPARSVSARGNDVAGTPMYWPWTQVVRALADGLTPGRLEAWLGDDLPGLLLLAPELGGPTHVAAAAPPPTGTPFEIGSALTRFLVHASQDEPLLLTFDDLDGADTGSVQLLQHVAGGVAGERILLLILLRSEDVAGSSPLLSAFARLGQLHHAEKVHLPPLSQDAVRDYVRAVLTDAPEELILALYERSEGNPLFLRELVALVLPSDGAAGRLELPARVPETVRALLAERLTRLPPEAARLLAAAAVAGRTFHHDLLAAVADDEQALTMVDAALQLHIVEETERAGVYRFAHSLFHEAMLGTMSRARRAQWHAQIGTALRARYGTGALQHAAELAVHFAEAAAYSPEFAADAVAFDHAAGLLAERVGGWDAARMHYERAMASLDRSPPSEDAERRAAVLLVAIGRCERAAGRWHEAWRLFMTAFEAHRRLGCPEGLAEAAIEAVLVPASPTRRLANVEEALALLGEGDPALRARLLVARADLSPDARDQAAADESLEAAEPSGSEGLRASALRRDAQHALAQMRVGEAVERLNEAYRGYASTRNYSQAADALRIAGDLRVATGDIAGGMDLLRRAHDYARRYGIVLQAQLILVSLAGIALARGDFAEVARLQQGFPGENYWRLLQRLWADADEHADDAQPLPSLELVHGVPDFTAIVGGTRARLCLAAGNEADARAELARIRPLLRAPSGGRPLTHTRLLAYAEADVALMLLSDDDVRAVYEDLLRWQPIRLSVYTGHSVDRLRAVLATRLGDLAAAERHGQAGLYFARTHGLRLEEAHCLAELGRVALLGGARQAAQDRYAASVDLYGALGARGGVVRARADWERLLLLRGSVEQLEPLTQREVEVLRHVAAGRTNNQIADDLFISPNTVSHHVTRILAKLGARNRTEAVRRAHQRGFILAGGDPLDSEARLDAAAGGENLPFAALVTKGR